MKGNVVGQGGVKVNDSLLANYLISTNSDTLLKGDLLKFNGANLESLPPRLKTIYDGTFDSISSGSIEIVDLDATYAVIVYMDSSTGYGKAVVLNKLTMAKGTVFTFESTSISSYGFSASLIDANKVLVTFVSSINVCKGVVLSISGTTVSKGTTVTLDVATTAGTSASVTIGLNKGLIVYSLTPSDNRHYAMVLTITGTTITMGTPVLIETGTTRSMYISLCRLSDDKVVVLTGMLNGTWSWYMRVLSVSGTVVTVNTAYLMHSGGGTSNYNNLITISSTSVLGFHSVLGVQKYDISGTTITKDATKTAASLANQNGSAKAVKLSDSKFAFFYRGTYGRMVVIKINPTELTALLSTDISTTTVSTQVAILTFDIDTLICLTDTTCKLYKIDLVKDTGYAKGLALQNGTAGQTIKAYDWR